MTTNGTATPPEAPTTPTAKTEGVTPPVVPATPPASLKVGEVEYTPEKIKELETQKAQLEKTNQATAVLMDDNATVQQRVGAVTTLMQAKGYSNADIKRYTDSMLEEAKTGETGGGGGEGAGGKGPNPLEERLSSIEETQQAQAEAQRKDKVEAFRLGLDSATQTALDGDGDLSLLFEDYKKVFNEEEMKGLREELKEELKNSILQQARTIQQESGTFSLSKYPEAAKQATAKVVKKYRRFIPPSLIGKVGATVLGPNSAAIQGKKAPPKPEYKKGDSIGDLSTKVSEYNSHELMQIAAGLESDGAGL